MLERITAPVFTRLERHPGRNLRDGALRTLADACEALPHDFRLGFGTQLDPRGRRGKIIDLRVQPATLQSADWDDDAIEPTLSVAMHWFDVPPRVDQTTSQCLAVVSLHALGRRYERGRDHSHAAIIADLQALATVNVNDADRFPEGGRFQVPTPRGTLVRDSGRRGDGGQCRRQRCAPGGSHVSGLTDPAACRTQRLNAPSFGRPARAGCDRWVYLWGTGKTAEDGAVFLQGGDKLANQFRTLAAVTSTQTPAAVRSGRTRSIGPGARPTTRISGSSASGVPRRSRSPPGPVAVVGRSAFQQQFRPGVSEDRCRGPTLPAQ